MRVTDNGRGIPAELLPTIFDMFVQERVTPDGAGGLGLGLGLVKRLVELHGGTRTRDERRPGNGRDVRDRAAARRRRHAVARSSNRMRTKHRPARRPLRAVVVDDAPDLRELVADLLRLRGHEVTSSSDGAGGDRADRAEQPDVALIDIGLPDMDGYEVARAIRTRSSTDVHSLRLIAMTGYGQASDRADGVRSAGFDAHIVKPASADKILRALYGSRGSMNTVETVEEPNDASSKNERPERRQRPATAATTATRRTASGSRLEHRELLAALRAFRRGDFTSSCATT